MKSIKICLLLLALGIAEKSWSQDLLNTITKSETERIEKYLSSDELEGRKTFSKGIDKAAAFIANEFAQAGLATFKNSGTYLQTFSRMSAKFMSASGNFDGNALDQKNIIVVTPQANFSITEASGYEVVKIDKEDNFGMAIRKYMGATKNYLILVDTSFAQIFGRLTSLKSNLTEQQKSVVFVLTNKTPKKFTILWI